MMFNVRSIASILAFSIVCLAGCSGERSWRLFADPGTLDLSDPFDVMVRTPEQRAPVYRVIEDRPPRMRTRQEPPEGTLSLSECVEIAIRNNPRSMVSLENVLAQQAEVGLTRGLRWPALNLQAGGTREQEQFPRTEAEVIENRYSVSASMNWTVADFGVREAAIKRAEAGYRASSRQHRSQLLDVGLAAEISYYRLLEAQELYAVARQALDQRKRHLELAERRHRLRLVTLVDVKQTRAELGQAELDLVATEGQERRARGRLAQVMGFPPSYDIQIAGLPDRVRQARAETVDKLLETAGANRPALKAQAAEIARQRQQLAVQKASRWPQISLVGSYGLTDKHLFPGTEMDEWLVGVNVTMELFTGFQRSYRIRQVEEQIKGAEQTYRALLRDAELEVWLAYQDVLEAQKAIGVAEGLVEARREQLELTETQYDQGRANVLDLVDAQQGHIGALASRVRATLAYYIAVARLERSVGQGLERVPSELRE